MSGDEGESIVKQAVIVCHRGACLVAPENTLVALEKAIDLGADVVEFDVRPSQDGVLYVMHDETVDRTTNGTGRFADMHSSEIDRLDAGGWFGALTLFWIDARAGLEPMSRSRKAIRVKCGTCWPCAAC